jgi:prepilin-type N-terminal cleavage/methylation domain-containing protein
MRSNKGFTLIELLVVISIIALLSSVVVSSLTRARNKGADAAVKEAMKQLYTESQNYLDSGANSFGASVANCTTANTIFTGTRFATILSNITANAALTSPNLACSTDSSGTKWSVSVNLRGGSVMCADNSTGNFSTGVKVSSAGICQ